MEQRKRITPRQRDVLAVIATHMLVNRMPPTMRELAQSMGLPHHTGVVSGLKALRKKGWLSKNGARGLRITAWPTAADVLPERKQ